MALPVSLAGVLNKGSFQQKPMWASPQNLRLSQIAKTLGCVGAVLPGAVDGNKPIVIGPNGPSSQLTTLNSTPTLDITEEGAAIKFAAASTQRVGGTLANNAAPTGVQNTSIVARIKFNSPSALGWGVEYGSASSRSLRVGHDSSGHAAAGTGSSAGSCTKAGSTVYTGFVTIGATAEPTAGTNTPNLYEDGVLIGATTPVNGDTTYTAQPLLSLGARIDNTVPLAGWVAWAFVFNKKLSDAEHFFVAKNPWALLEFGESFLVGKTAAAGGTTTLTPSLFTNTQTFYAPKLVETLKPALFTNSQTFFTPPLSGTLNTDICTNSQSFFAPTLRETLKPGLFTNSQTFYGPRLAIRLSPALFANSQTFYAPQIRTALTLTPSLFTNSQVFYSPTVVVLTPVTLLPGLFVNTQTFFSPRIVFPALAAERRPGASYMPRTAAKKRKPADVPIFAWASIYWLELARQKREEEERSAEEARQALAEEQRRLAEAEEQVEALRRERKRTKRKAMRERLAATLDQTALDVPQERFATDALAGLAQELAELRRAYAERAADDADRFIARMEAISEERRRSAENERVRVQRMRDDDEAVVALLLAH